MDSKYASCMLHIFMYLAEVIQHIAAMKKASNENTLWQKENFSVFTQNMH